MRSFFAKRGSGLDIGSRSAKFVQLRKDGDRIVLDEFFSIDLLSRENNTTVGFDGFSLLRGALQAVPNLATATGISVSSKDLFIFDLALPILPENEIEAVVANELEQKLNAPIIGFAFDFISLESNDNSVMNIRAYCLRRTGIDSRISLLRDFNLSPALVLSDCLANLEVMKFNGYLNKCRHAVAVEIGESHTVCSLISHGELVTSSTIMSGTGLTIHTVKDHYGITYAEAVQHIKTALSDKNSEHYQPMIEIHQATFERILSEVRTSIEYYRSSLQGDVLENIFLLGGGAQESSLKDLFQEMFGIPTDLVNPLKNIEIFTPENQILKITGAGGYLAPAIGLALRRIG